MHVSQRHEIHCLGDLPIQGPTSHLQKYKIVWRDYPIVHQVTISPFATFEFHFEVQ